MWHVDLVEKSTSVEGAVVCVHNGEIGFGNVILKHAVEFTQLAQQEYDLVASDLFIPSV